MGKSVDGGIRPAVLIQGSKVLRVLQFHRSGRAFGYPRLQNRRLRAPLGNFRSDTRSRFRRKCRGLETENLGAEF